MGVIKNMCKKETNVSKVSQFSPIGFEIKVSAYELVVNRTYKKVIYKKGLGGRQVW